MAISPLNRKRIYWLTITWSIICILLLLQLLITEGLRPELFTTFEVFGTPAVRWLVGWCLILFLVLPVYVLLEKRSWFIKGFGFGLTGLIFSVGYVVLGIWCFQLLQGAIEIEEILNAAIEGFLSSLHHIITYYLMLLAVLLAIDYLRDKLEAVRSRKEVEQQLAETRLRVLKNQLQPHFLFNALNSVTSILEYKPEVAQDMLVDISTLLRTSLQIDYGQLIPLKKELEILQTYLDIEQRRFEHQLQVAIEVSPETGTALVPPFILQPLVENAIKHGFREGTDSLLVKIQTTGSEGAICLEVANNGAALQSADSRIGLSSVRERLKTTFGDRAGFKLKQVGDWVINQIEIRTP